MPTYGVETVTAPGAIDGFCRLLADHGRLGMAEVLAPAIRYADEGVPVAPRVACDWAEVGHLSGDARRFLLHDGRAPVAGALFRAPGQAEVLRRIAAQGRAGFYEGEVAEDMVASLRALGGTHTQEDFATTACDYVEPIRGAYRGWELMELPPNGQGATAILMARILERFDLAALEPFGVARTHLEAEAAKLACDARNRFIADPTRVEVKLADMLSEARAGKLAGLIDPARAMGDPAPLTESIHRDTICLSVVDRDRMAVSLIYSVYLSFGSGLASARFGINFQNRGAGFTLKAGHPNEAGGGKRPMHTIIPAMLLKAGDVVMPYCVMGGGYQPAGHVRVMTNMVDWGMHPQQAIDGPRSFPTPEGLAVEGGYAAAVRDGLALLGHRIAPRSGPFGGAQAVLIDRARGLLVGASDPRKDGCALGY
jgi:gamma-glutamyltranspeptidase/glutathione hydrolase